MDEEQRRDRVAGTIDGNVEFRRAQPPDIPVSGSREIDGVGRRVGKLKRCHERDLGSGAVQHREGVAKAHDVSHRAACEELQLEVVRRDDVGGPQRLVREKFRHTGSHENAASDIADHGIAAIERRRIDGFDPRHRTENRVARVGCADIARQDGVTAGQGAALRDPLHAGVNQRRGKHLAAPRAVAGVVRELYRVDRPDLVAEALHRKNRGGIADMSVRDMGLDGEDVHAHQCSAREEPMQDRRRDGR